MQQCPTRHTWLTYRSQLLYTQICNVKLCLGLLVGSSEAGHFLPGST